MIMMACSKAVMVAMVTLLLIGGVKKGFLRFKVQDRLCVTPQSFAFSCTWRRLAYPFSTLHTT